VKKTPRELREQIAVDPYAGDGVVVTRDLGGGYTQTQLGPRAPQIPVEILDGILDLPDPDRPPPERIHVITADPADDELLEIG
jgi:hypothetical protein